MTVATFPSLAAVSAGGRFQLLTVDDLQTLPQPEWLVRGILRAESRTVLYGAPGHGKTFVALDLALSIAAGVPWHGRPVKQGPVVYVVSEGGRGVLKRVEAWRNTRGISDIGPAFFLLDTVKMLEPSDVRAFLRKIEERRVDGHPNPALIVFDTFAMSFLGGDENTVKDMSQWVESSRVIVSTTGAAVMAIHHSGKAKQNQAVERGSSALRGGMETMIFVRSAEGSVELKCEKQKDDECFGEIHLEMKTVSLGADEDGQPVTSLAVVSRDAVGLPPVFKSRLAVGPLKALDVLRRLPNGQASSGEWRAALPRTFGKPVSESTFHRWRNELLQDGVVKEVEGGRHVYRALPAAMGVPQDSHESDQSDSRHSQQPVGLGVEGGIAGMEGR